MKFLSQQTAANINVHYILLLVTLPIMQSAALFQLATQFKIFVTKTN